MEPAEWQKQAINEGQLLRGWIVNSYAQIEFFLGDLIVRSLTLPEYAKLAQTLPHGAPGRIKRVRQILTQGGFFDKFSNEISEIIDEFSNHHETRNLLAHGFCEFHFTKKGDFGLQFRKWHRQEGRQDALLLRTFRLRDLEAQKIELTALAQRALLLFRRIHDSLGLVVNAQ